MFNWQYLGGSVPEDFLSPERNLHPPITNRSPRLALQQGQSFSRVRPFNRVRTGDIPLKPRTKKERRLSPSGALTLKYGPFFTECIASVYPLEIHLRSFLLPWIKVDLTRWEARLCLAMGRQKTWKSLTPWSLGMYPWFRKQIPRL